jgi:hypothetical protein
MRYRSDESMDLGIDLPQGKFVEKVPTNLPFGFTREYGAY